MQFFGLHRNIYKRARYARTQESLKEEASGRRKLLNGWDLLKARKVPDAEIASITGLSRSSYYRRLKALTQYGFKGLERRSTRPEKVRQSKIPQATHQLALKLRQ